MKDFLIHQNLDITEVLNILNTLFVKTLIFDTEPNYFIKVYTILKKAYEDDGAFDFLRANNSWSFFLMESADPDQQKSAIEMMGSLLNESKLKCIIKRFFIIKRYSHEYCP